MGLAVFLLVGAAAVAGATGGSLAALSTVPIRGARLVVIAVIAQLVGIGLLLITGVSGFYPAGLAVSALAALAFCARNLRLDGVPLVTIGLVLNAVVVSLNATMPVSVAAAARAGVSIHQITTGDDARHSIASGATTWRVLGDVIPVPLPWRPEVVSPGDALIAAGLGQLVLIGMRPRRRRRDSGRRDPTDVALTQPDEEISWPRRSASAAPEPRARPTTASARTADLGHPLQPRV